MSLATSVRDSFDVREPLVDLETRKFSDFKDCTHKADIVIVYHSNSFSSFLLWGSKEMTSATLIPVSPRLRIRWMHYAVSLAKCCWSVLLPSPSMPSTKLSSLPSLRTLKFSLPRVKQSGLLLIPKPQPGQYPQIFVLYAWLCFDLWNVNARGVVDAPTYLKRISPILDLPFGEINPSLYPAACADIDSPMAEVVYVIIFSFRLQQD